MLLTTFTLSQLQYKNTRLRNVEVIGVDAKTESAAKDTAIARFDRCSRSKEFLDRPPKAGSPKKMEVIKHHVTVESVIKKY